MWILCQLIQSSSVPEVSLCSVSKESLQEDPACLQDIGEFNNGARCCDLVKWNPLASYSPSVSIQVKCTCFSFITVCHLHDRNTERPHLRSAPADSWYCADTQFIAQMAGTKKKDEIKGFRWKIKSSNASRLRWNPALMSIRVLSFISMWPGFLPWLTCPKL